VRARLQAALLAAPSVGLMQPLRVLRISDPGLRESLARRVDAERLRTAEALGPRAAEFLALKVDGVRECAELWALVLAPDDGTVFGRRTLAREMVWCSAGAAVQNLWLAARAENLGLGWVSLFEPADLHRLLALPADAAPLGLLCIGPVDRFYEAPMLIQQQWRQARPASAVFTENAWDPSWTTGGCATPEHLPQG
jgi:5,6-dimethylbenzimidazole synthase